MQNDWIAQRRAQNRDGNNLAHPDGESGLELDSFVRRVEPGGVHLHIVRAKDVRVVEYGVQGGAISLAVLLHGSGDVFCGLVQRLPRCE